MSTPQFIEAFYSRIWNEGDLSAADELLTKEFIFRGSLGIEMNSITAFKDYVCSIRNSLSNYHCEILDCLAGRNKAFAKMRFSGNHTGVFRGYQPAGKPIQWLGAALFTFQDRFISELWVLGDLAALDSILRANAEAQ